ncbi:MAG: hypothetical protein LUG16_01840, partial [Candidatus Gastranaerophilales bacterium]|nr:hypothetical protein [Candidatus Gastranaerophilales bacterium]
MEKFNMFGFGGFEGYRFNEIEEIEKPLLENPMVTSTVEMLDGKEVVVTRQDEHITNIMNDYLRQQGIQGRAQLEAENTLRSHPLSKNIENSGLKTKKFDYEYIKNKKNAGLGSKSKKIDYEYINNKMNEGAGRKLEGLDIANNSINDALYGSAKQTTKNSSKEIAEEAAKRTEAEKIAQQTA